MENHAQNGAFRFSLNKKNKFFTGCSSCVAFHLEYELVQNVTDILMVSRFVEKPRKKIIIKRRISRRPEWVRVFLEGSEDTISWVANFVLSIDSILGPRCPQLGKSLQHCFYVVGSDTDLAKHSLNLGPKNQIMF